MKKKSHGLAKTHEQFMLDFEIKQSKLFNEIKILSDYESINKHIFIKTKYGICKSQPSNLLEGYSPTIKSALDPTFYFKNTLKELQPKLFDSILIIGKYISAHTKILIQNKFGICDVEPNSLLQGTSPTILSAINPHSYFLNMFKDKQPELFEELTILSQYNDTNTHLFVQDKYGVCKVQSGNLLSGRRPFYKVCC